MGNGSVYHNMKVRSDIAKNSIAAGFPQKPSCGRNEGNDILRENVFEEPTTRGKTTMELDMSVNAIVE